jgi:hypothetical protein
MVPQAQRAWSLKMFALDCPIQKQAWSQEVGQRNGFSTPPQERGLEQPWNHAGIWEPAVRKMVEMRNLADDWDGLGALAPSPALLESAISLAFLFHEKGVNPPQSVVPGLDGTVNLEWQDPDGTIAEVEIDRPFHAEVMVIEPGKSPKFWTLPTE